MRKEEAAALIIAQILPLLKPFKAVLSFHPMPGEIDMTELNLCLATENRLLLSRITEENTLSIHSVTEIGKELQPNIWGLLEPDPSLCCEIDMAKIDCILVPGLGFDHRGHRIGYGKGHYDRFLGKIKAQGFSPKVIGLGFKEQLVEEGVPNEDHDIALDGIFLF